LRGKEIAYIPQEPLSALNPVLSIGRQLEQVVTYHSNGSWRERRKIRWETRGLAAAALQSVGIRGSQDVMRKYPHELSGGMRQRVMIAMALIARPKLIIADEPTTALDVTTQAQILALIEKLQAETGSALLLITHDLAVAAQVADEVAVMYSGRIVEKGTAEQLYGKAAHPYSRGLLDAIPRLEGDRCRRLRAIPGSVPSLSQQPSGCHFSPRCPWARDRCKSDEPALQPVGELGPQECQHLVACWYPLTEDGERNMGSKPDVNKIV